MARPDLRRVAAALAAQLAKRLRSRRALSPKLRNDIAGLLEQLAPKSAETEVYIKWLRSGRDLSPDVPIRHQIATFLARRAESRRGRPPIERILQRYARRQERLPWITRVKDEQLKLKAQCIRRHFDGALEIVAGESGAPSVETLRKWVRRPDKVGTSRFLPLFDDGTWNVDPEQI